MVGFAHAVAVQITPAQDACIKLVVGTEITVATVGVTVLPSSQVSSNNNDITDKAVKAIENCITNPEMANNTQSSGNVLH